MATSAAILKFVLRKFKVELALSAIFYERHFLISSNLTSKSAFYNMATSPLILN